MKHTQTEPKFYAVLDDGGIYLQTGYNSTSLEDLRNDLLELLQPETDPIEFKIMQKLTAEDIVVMKGWAIEVNTREWPDAFEADESTTTESKALHTYEWQEDTEGKVWLRMSKEEFSQYPILKEENEKLKEDVRVLMEALVYLLKNFDSDKNSAEAIVKANSALNQTK